MGRRGEDGKDIFEEDARLWKIRCLGDGLSEVVGLLLAFFSNGLYFITGELGGCGVEISIHWLCRWNLSLLEVVVAWDSGREGPWSADGSVTTVEELMVNSRESRQRKGVYTGRPGDQKFHSRVTSVSTYCIIVGDESNSTHGRMHLTALGSGGNGPAAKSTLALD